MGTEDTRRRLRVQGAWQPTPRDGDRREGVRWRWPTHGEVIVGKEGTMGSVGQPGQEGTP